MTLWSETTDDEGELLWDKLSLILWDSNWIILYVVLEYIPKSLQEKCSSWDLRAFHNMNQRGHETTDLEEGGQERDPQKYSAEHQCRCILSLFLHLTNSLLVPTKIYLPPNFLVCQSPWCLAVTDSENGT